MSFGVGVGDVLAVVRLAKGVQERLSKAPEQFQSTSKSVETLSSILEGVKDIATSVDVKERKERLDKCVEHCGEVLRKLQVKLEGYKGLQDDPGAKKRSSLSKFYRTTVQKAKWDPKEIGELQQEIDRSIGPLQLILAEITKADMDETRRSQKTLEEKKTCKEILAWLDPTGYAKQQANQHRDLLDEVCKGTGQWLLESAEFQSWLGQKPKNQILLCLGEAGTGKTMLAASAIGRLLNLPRDESSINQPSNSPKPPAPGPSGSIGVAFFYCDFRQKQEQGAVDVLTCLLYRLLLGRPKLILKNTGDLYKRHQENETRPSLSEISDLLQLTVSDYWATFIVIDALDELPGDNSRNSRNGLISELLSLQANILITSRPIGKIETAFTKCQNGNQCQNQNQNPRVKTLEIVARDADISMYLDSYAPPECLSSRLDLQQEVRDEILKAAAGIFLVARLYIAFITESVSVRDVKVELNKIKARKGSDAYNEAYKRAMERVLNLEGPRRRLAEKALSWVSYAQRPLTPQELRYAIAVDVSEAETILEATNAAFDEDSLSPIDDIMAACTGLLTIDKEQNIVRFIHYTTQEYLQRTLTESWFAGAEKGLSLICMKYLSMVPGYCLDSDAFNERLNQNPFYEYAAKHWGHHVRKSSMEESEVTLGFLENQDLLAGTTQAYLVNESHLQSKGQPSFDKILPSVRITSPLHLTAWIGLAKATSSLVRIYNLDKDGKDGRGLTPLHCAADQGHEETLGGLLALGADPNLPSNEDLTALHVAASSNHYGVLEQLLDSGANPNIRNISGITALHAAAYLNFGRVLERLVASGADLNIQNKFGWTALHVAARYNHDRVVKQLLVSSADLNTQDNEGSTALHFAVLYDDNRVVGQLLASGADPNIQNNEGSTALYFAVLHDDDRVVGQLLASGADPNIQNNEGSTALHFAVLHDEDRVVGQLLASGADPNIQDKWGRTALHTAARYNKGRVVEQLLASRADPNIQYNGQTALGIAVRYDHDGVVDEFLAFHAELNIQKY